MNYRFFVGHRKPEFPIWKGFEYFELTQPTDDVSPDERMLYDHRRLGEFASLFQLCNLLSKEGVASGQITIAHYRRFVLNLPLGLKSTNHPWARVLSASDMTNLTIEDEVSPLPGLKYLIGSGIELPNGMLANYAGSHYTRDILRFTANAVDCGVLSNIEAFHFLSQPILIVNPTCGSFPLQSFLGIIQKAETVTKSFLASGYQVNEDPYQGRTLNFLLERFTSYLLLDHLMQEGQNMHQLMGSTTVISDSLEIPRGAMAKNL
jgi:hypothetical protein